MPLAARSLLLDAELAGERIIAVGERGHVLVSNDRGESWRQVVVPTRSMLTAVTAPDQRHAWAVGHDSIILFSEDGGLSWVRQFSAPELEQPLLDVWFADRGHGVAVGAYGTVMTTADGGQSWQGSLIDPEEPHANAIAQAPDGGLYIAAELGLVFRSDDRGRTWTRLSTRYGGSLFGVLALRDGSLLTFGLRGHLFRSTDRGERWQRIETNTSASLFGGVQRSDGMVLVGGLDGVLLVSDDGGRTFAHRELPTRQAITAIVDVAPDRVILLGEDGVRSTSRPVGAAGP